jgi:hypothetical protein
MCGHTCLRMDKYNDKITSPHSHSRKRRRRRHPHNCSVTRAMNACFLHEMLHEKERYCVHRCASGSGVTAMDTYVYSIYGLCRLKTFLV